MTGLAARFFGTALVYAVLGMTLGLIMGISHDHSQMPAHAHLLVIGWVSFALYGFFYHLFPKAAGASLAMAHFWIALALLGIGWNFAFIGATTLVTQAHRPEERNKVQSFNDFLIFGTMAIGSFASGKVLATLGWTAVNEVVFPPVLLAVAMLGWLVLRERRGRLA